MSDPLIRVAEAEEDLAAIGIMIGEYAAACGYALCFDGLGDEIATLPGAYGPPHGRLLIAVAGDDPAGCVGVRRIGDGIAEMKRLYVRPAYRRHRLGHALCLAILAAASALGYHTLRLDTRWDMTEAKTLYRGLGFRPIPAYYDTAEDGVEFFERSLEGGPLALVGPRRHERSVL